MKTNVVIGGGTAGALAALYWNMVNTPRQSEVRTIVIKSDDIGIIGAGEGTTPAFVALMEMLDISLNDLIQKTNATIKNGIRFTNWRGGGEDDDWMHPFWTHSGLGIDDITDKSFYLTYPGAFAKHYEKQESPDKTDLTAAAAKYGKALFTTEPQSGNLFPLQNFAVHFDAQVLADFLLSVAEARGVEMVEGKVVDFIQDEEGNVTSLVLESGEKVECDFILDASGMARLFPKAFESEWVSWTDHLITDTAITFFEPPSRKMSAYTHATAMENGWIWQIPLIHRTGCGYVFDSNRITPEEAKAELEAKFGKEIEVVQTLKFKPGYYKDIWKNNVVSIGLSSGFIEPLEATSIWTTIMQLETLLSNPIDIYNPAEQAKNWYNSEMSSMQEDIAAFVYFHYMGRSTEDSKFWSHFNRDNAPKRLKEILKISDWRTLRREDVSTWSLVAFYYTAFGIEYEPLLSRIKESIKDNFYLDIADSDYVNLKEEVEETADKALLDHRGMLELLGGTKWEDI